LAHGPRGGRVSKWLEELAALSDDSLAAYFEQHAVPPDWREVALHNLKKLSSR